MREGTMECKPNHLSQEEESQFRNLSEESRNQHRQADAGDPREISAFGRAYGVHTTSFDLIFVTISSCAIKMKIFAHGIKTGLERTSHQIQSG
jgi:hypothetical protein